MISHYELKPALTNANYHDQFYQIESIINPIIESTISPIIDHMIMIIEFIIHPIMVIDLIFRYQ